MSDLRLQLVALGLERRGRGSDEKAPRQCLLLDDEAKTVRGGRGVGESLR